MTIKEPRLPRRDGARAATWRGVYTTRVKTAPKPANVIYSYKFSFPRPVSTEEQATYEQACLWVLSRLTDRYAFLQDGDPVAARLRYAGEVYPTLVHNPERSADEILEEVVAEPQKVVRAGGDWVLQVAGSFLAESSRAAKGDIPLAWESALRAAYWAGVCDGQTPVVDNAAALATAAIKSHGASGGKAKAQRYAPLKEQVFKWARERCPPNGWHSPNAASTALMKDASEFLKKNPMGLRDENIGVRMAGWFSRDLEQDEFDHLFPNSRRSKRA